MATTETPTRKINRKGPFFIVTDGLLVGLKSAKTRGHFIKSMLVSHACVELIKMIRDDHEFSQPLFDALSESERDYMRYLFKRCNIESREFDSSYNKTLEHLVSRLNILQGARDIGDDNPSIKSEMLEILKKLYDKNMFNTSHYYQLRRAFET